jgi:hypothetical protein
VCGWFGAGGVVLLPQGLICFLLEVFIIRISLVVCRVIAVAEYTPYSAGAFLTWALASRVVTSAFNASGLEVTKMFRVPITLTVGTLWNVR